MKKNNTSDIAVTLTKADLKQALKELREEANTNKLTLLNEMLDLLEAANLKYAPKNKKQL